MSNALDFVRIVAWSWTHEEMEQLRHEASLQSRVEEARRGYREAMESTGISLDQMTVPDVYEALYHNPWEDLYAEWDEGAEYAHDEDDNG